ncbi:MAG TPA: hypothetical protein VGD85_10095 [Nocardioides sp.]
MLFSPEEWATVEQRARECGVRANCYIRETVLGTVPRARPNGATRELVVAINRIGNDLNRLARIANENGDLPSEAEFDVLREELMEVLARVVGVGGGGKAGVGTTPRRPEAKATSA